MTEPKIAPRKKKMKRCKEDVIFDTVVFIVLTLILLIVAYPLYWVVISSISDPSAVSGGKVIDVLPLPIAGLMSDRRYEEVTEKLSAMQKETRELGISENVDPFVTLSFMALTVIPEIRVTERGVYLF